MTELPRYKVEIPFSATSNARLKPPYDLRNGAQLVEWVDHSELPEGDDEKPKVLFQRRVSFTKQEDELLQDADPGAPPRPRPSSEYSYSAVVHAESAQAAVDSASAEALAFLHVLAARQFAFEIGPPANRYCKRLDPPTDGCADVDLEFDTIDMRKTDKAAMAAECDPDGSRRRRGTVFSSINETEVTHNDLDLDAELYAGHMRRDDRIERAAEIYRLGQCSSDEAIRFLLSCLTLEVLVDHQRTAIVGALLKPARKQLAREMRELLEAHDVGDPDKIVSRMQETEQQSYVTSAGQYLDQLGIDRPEDLVSWVQGQRGALVHAGTVTEDDDDGRRRNDLVKLVGVAIVREMAQVIGRPVDDLLPAQTLTWLQVWRHGQREFEFRVGG